MIKKIVAFALAVMLFNAGSGIVFAETKVEKDTKRAEKVKAGIFKLGTGPEALVKLKLDDKTKLQGYIGEAGADTFTVIDAKTGMATTVAYPQVRQVQGNNLSKGAKIAIGIGIAVAVLVIIAVAIGKAAPFPN